MKKIERLIALLLVIGMLATCIGCTPASEQSSNDSSQTTTPSDSQSDDADGDGAAPATEIDFSEFTSKITPLEEPVELNTCIGICILHDLPTYLAYKTGLLEAYGIKANLVYFTNGPLMVEAMAAGSIDCGGYGLGGILSGSVQGITDILWIRADEGSMQQYHVPNDAAIVQSGINPETGFYGTAEDWKNMNVFMAAGTAMEYTLGAAMEKLGLTFDDMNITKMTTENVLAALYAGQGDAWSLGNLYGYLADVQEGYTKILDGCDVGAEIYAATVASKEAMKDETKRQAILTWMECVMAVTNWLNASEENKEIAVQYLIDWNEEQGVDTGGADLYAYLNDITFLDLDDQLDLYSTGESGLLKVEESIMDNFDFYVNQGNYQESDRELLLDGDFTPVAIEYLSEKYGS